MEIAIIERSDGMYEASAADHSAELGASPDEAIGALVRAAYLTDDEVTVTDISTVTVYVRGDSGKMHGPYDSMDEAQADAQRLDGRIVFDAEE